MTLLCVYLTAAEAKAAPGDATWSTSPASNLWQDPPNWSPGVPLPTGTATFGNSNITSITSLGGSDIFISEMRFSPGAPAYNFLVSGGNFFIIRGTGIVNNSSFAPSFAVTNSSVLLFFGNATAGDTNITATNSGQVQFASSSTGGTATITANGGAIIFFLDQSSAPQAHLIINSGGTLDLSFLTSGAISLGSIQGAGTFSFGSAEVTVGSAVAFGHSTEVSGIIADGGANGGVGASLIKAGTGTLILTGNNTYTGGTTISQGTLQLGNGGTTGSILGNVSDNAIFAIDRSDTFTFSGNIGGTGSFQQIGPGTTILSGNSTYLGTTTVMSGTLQLGNGGASGSIVGNVIDNGIFAINRSDAFTFGGVISGTGSFQQLGTGTTILTAVNSYSGGTTISAGVLNVSADHNLGAASGGLTLNGGTLQFGSTFNLANTRTITLNGGGGTFDTDGFDTTISQRITGVGGLIKTGPGILTLSGSDSYSGGTVINAGILLVNNAQALGLGNVVLNGGILEADPQPINVKGNYAQNAAGTLLLQVAGAGSGQYDFLNVSGNANLGGTLQLTNLGYKPKVGDQLTLVTAGGLVTSRFAHWVNPFTTGHGINTIDLVYGRNSVVLKFLNILPPAPPVITTIDFASFAQTPNQFAAANLLDAVQLDPRASNLMFFLHKEPFGNLRSDFDKISPESLTAFYEISFSGANIQRLNLENRLEDIRNSSIGASGTGATVYPEDKADGKSAKNPPVLPPVREKRWGFWATSFGDFVHVDSDFNARGYKFTTGGIDLGIDYRLTDHLAFGLMGNYAHTWSDLRPGSIDVDSARGGIYATYFNNCFYLNGGIYGGYNSYDSSRRGLQGNANGNSDGAEFSTFVSGGYDFHFGHLTMGPIASLQYTNVYVDGFREKGSLAPLSIHSDSEESLRSDVGFRASYQWQAGSVHVEPFLKATWEHEFKYSTLPITAGFADVSGPSATFLGPSEGHDGAVVDAGLSVSWTPTISTYVSYNALLGRDRYDSNGVSGGIRIRF